jgi:hypothetical protein
MSSRRFAKTTSAKRKGRAYGKGVGLGLGVLLALTVISLAVWLLRRSASDESTSATPEPGESVEAGLEEQAVVPPDTPSAEDVSRGSSHHQARNAPSVAEKRLHRHQPPEKNRPLERSGPEDAKVRYSPPVRRALAGADLISRGVA